MGKKPSTHEHILFKNEHERGSRMEKTAHDLIIRIKKIKEENKITFNRIIEQMEEDHQINNELPVVSLTTLRRVFSSGSESRATSYNFEETLLPIAEAIDKIAPMPEEVPAYIKEIEGLKNIIAVQNGELDRLLEINSHLNERVTFLIGQINLKDKRIDEKEETIRELMNKYVLNKE